MLRVSVVLFEHPLSTQPISMGAHPTCRGISCFPTNVLRLNRSLVLASPPAEPGQEAEPPLRQYNRRSGIGRGDYLDIDVESRRRLTSAET